MRRKAKTTNANDLIDQLQRKKDREKTSLYLSKGLYKRFKAACGNAPVSPIIERLMEDFLAAKEQLD